MKRRRPATPAPDGAGVLPFPGPRARRGPLRRPVAVVLPFRPAEDLAGLQAWRAALEERLVELGRQCLGVEAEIREADARLRAARRGRRGGRPRGRA